MKINGKRVCNCGCGRTFKPKKDTQLYVNPSHRNRENQRRWRERAKQSLIAEAING